MAKRNVVDFKIINLSEEKFQELKEAGQIDPNALYCTPDTTKARLTALESTAAALESTAATLESTKANDSDVVHKTGNETVQGSKTFLNNTLWKYDVIEVGVPPETNKYATWASVYDKNNKMVSFLETAHLTDGTLSLVIGERTYIDGSAVTNSLTFRTDANGNRTAVLAYSPLASSNDRSVATTQWAKTLFLPLAGGTITGNIVTSGQYGYAFGNGAKIRNSGSNNESLTMFLKDSDWKRSYIGLTSGRFEIYAGDGTNVAYLIGKSDGTLTWNDKPIVRLVAKQDPTSSNNHAWYRKYSDGWVEQGGRLNITSNNRTIPFPVSMANKENYTLQLTVTSAVRYACVEHDTDRTTTGFKVATADDNTVNNDGVVDWYVCGYAAQ